jgi:hypothetical protein
MFTINLVCFGLASAVLVEQMMEGANFRTILFTFTVVVLNLAAVVTNL